MNMSDSENFNRLIRLLARGGTMVLRKLLEKYSAPLNFADYIYQNQGLVLKLKFFENQRMLVVARNIDQMDITLLGKLALGLFKTKMTAKEKDCVDKIKEERDKFMHSDMLETAKVATPLYNRRWQEISSILLDLADEMEADFKDDLQAFIDGAKQCSPDLAEIHKTLVEWCTSNKDLEKKLQSLALKVDELKATPTVNVKFEALKDKFQCQLEYTASRLDIQHTGKMKIARDHLLKDYSVMLYGNPGEGKTTTAFHIVKSLVEEGVVSLNKCVVLLEPSDLKDIQTAEVDILIIDDIFGKHNAE